MGELLELVGLTGREHERVEGFSRGMKQRLHIARGLLHDPQVLFLDEPTLGLDPIGARELRETIAELVRSGKTVLLTTHYMFEADQLCDRIAVIAKGEIVAEGTPTDLKANVTSGRVVEIEVFGVEEAAVERMRSVPGAAPSPAPRAAARSRNADRSECRRRCRCASHSPDAAMRDRAWR